MVRRVAVGHVHPISCSRASIVIFSWEEGVQLPVEEKDMKTQDFLFKGRSTPADSSLNSPFLQRSCQGRGMTLQISSQAAED